MSLIEGRDYYIEKGRYVFTSYYLKSRGYCCGSGCRHCPYGEVENQAENLDSIENTAKKYLKAED